MMRMASERGDVSAVVFLSDTVAAGQAACRTVDELFPAAGKVGALSAEVLDEDGERVPPLAVCGAVDQGGWPSGPCGTVRLWAQGTVGLLLRRAQLDAAVCPGTRAVAGPPLRVTRCDASALLRLDGRPPREALRSAFGAASAEDQLQLKGGGAMLALHSRQESNWLARAPPLAPGPARERGRHPSRGGQAAQRRRAAPPRSGQVRGEGRRRAGEPRLRHGALGGVRGSSGRLLRLLRPRLHAELLEQDVAALAPQAACGFLGRGQLAPPGVTLGGSTAGTEDPDPDRTPGESFAVHRCSALVACLRFGQ
ncbi:unnamed protein product [Prorocentrum cordatum]|uniref:FIST domain-containing protein n=1 Tax=Prorocentrum cordatum TaxID=2364126 RepID=A0ABN9QT24_9DINO|nr:unnamed protein product [Polarella glacialis]